MNSRSKTYYVFIKMIFKTIETKISMIYFRHLLIYFKLKYINSLIVYRNFFSSISSKFFFLLCFIISKFSYCQFSVVPYLLKSGAYTYVKTGTPYRLDSRDYLYINPFNEGGFSFAYSPTECIVIDTLLKPKFRLNLPSKNLINDVFDLIKPLNRSIIYNDKSCHYINLKSNYYSFLEVNEDNVVVSGLLNEKIDFIYHPDKNFGFFEFISEDKIIGRQNRAYGGGSGVIDLNGNIVIPINNNKYSSGGFNKNLILFERDNKYGYIDKYGNIKINPQFNRATDFILGIAEADDKFINSQGNTVELKKYLQSVLGTLNFEVSFLSVGSENLKSVVSKLIVYHYEDRSKPYIYSISIFDEKLKLTNSVKNIDLDPNPTKWRVNCFHDDVAVIQDTWASRTILYDFKRKAIIDKLDCDYKFSGISENSFVYCSENKKGIKNLKGQIIIPANYFSIMPFKYGHTIGRNENGWFLIDTSGFERVKLPGNYDEGDLEIISPNFIKYKPKTKVFRNGYEIDQYFLIDFNGFEYRDNDENIQSNLAVLKKIQIEAEIEKKQNEIKNKRENDSLLNLKKIYTEQRINDELNRISASVIGDIITEGVILKKNFNGSCLIVSQQAKLLSGKDLYQELQKKGKGWRLPTLDEVNLIKSTIKNNELFKNNFYKTIPQIWDVLAKDDNLSGFWYVDFKKKKETFYSKIDSISFWLLPVREYPTYD